MFKYLARFYVVVAAVSTAWMWYVEFTMQNAPHDHSLPWIVAAMNYDRSGTEGSRSEGDQ